MTMCLREYLLKRNTYHSIVHLKFDKNNPKKVVEDLDEMSADENERLEAYKRKLEIIDYNTTMAQAEERGRKENSKEIARKMKEEGMSIEIIAKMTGLAKEEIETL